MLDDLHMIHRHAKHLLQRPRDGFGGNATAGWTRQHGCRVGGVLLPDTKANCESHLIDIDITNADAMIKGFRIFLTLLLH